MGFFYKKDGDNKTFGFKVSIKFGKGSSTEDKCHKWAEYILSILEKCGVKVEKDSDNDPNKDKRLF